MDWNDKILEFATKIRKTALKTVIDLKAGYLGQVCGSAEILATIINVANIGPSLGPMVPPLLDKENDINGGIYFGEKKPEYDRIIFSASHYAIGIYSMLIVDGRLSPDAMKQFNNSGTIMEQVGDDHSPGYEIVSGSFGQALGQAGGISMARKRAKDSGRNFVFIADGELEEGSTWESIQAMAHFKLDNMIVFVDVNGMQADGLTKDVMNIEPIATKLTGFGCDVFTVNGNSPEAIKNAIDQHQYNGRPTFILCYTDMTTGMPTLKSVSKDVLHFVSIKPEDLQDYIDIYEKM
ncbi:hypothetical protein AN639_02000 [Candidatus Epulonipiscium fishelsonii]|uniref:Uncharacterized protein n=1 Tax=Candidatus Epulonipiscium fishelsonii TaxID=77094 RepID=A0ACC8X8Q6_9FIRM|nr:hypothetical protein AN396_10960 [Epulopiscium sp. SCG-B11WGA-EpuloA1]ONI38977.1 hypothetical protein AN639_02000 [Epulopiscium sp. SCG-B05WGA-EpuloA1]ONI47471.1 hypothetical protein AN644_05090 [Epulopiscium sp. SCG-C06WGA-EpuloA1]